MRDGGWKAAGLTRPNSWWTTAVLAVGAAAVLQLGSELVVGPLASRIWPGPQHVSHALESAALGWRQARTSLLIIWTFAAFGEELSYRGYLLTRAADIFGRSRAAYVMAVILVAMLFGFAHYYKGRPVYSTAPTLASCLAARMCSPAEIFGRQSWHTGSATRLRCLCCLWVGPIRTQAA